MSLDNISVAINTPTSYRVEVDQSGGRLQTHQPISLRNIIAEKTTVQQLGDIENVTIINKVDGSTIQYNSSTSKYEVRLAALDGGTF